MIDKTLFIEIKPNVIISYGVERNRDLEKRLKKIKDKNTKKKNK
tara:strand:- start:90 stop:221 length:132 start_codon:yes stop_codon:yes gene_type:complete